MFNTTNFNLSNHDWVDYVISIQSYQVFPRSNSSDHHLCVNCNYQHMQYVCTVWGSIQSCHPGSCRCSVEMVINIHHYQVNVGPNSTFNHTYFKSIVQGPQYAISLASNQYGMQNPTVVLGRVRHKEPPYVRILTSKPKSLSL